MAESNPRPLVELLFGPAQPSPSTAEVELAEAISIWFQAKRKQLHDGASFGTPSAELVNSPDRRS